MRGDILRLFVIALFACLFSLAVVQDAEAFVVYSYEGHAKVIVCLDGSSYALKASMKDALAAGRKMCPHDMVHRAAKGSGVDVVPAALALKSPKERDAAGSGDAARGYPPHGYPC